MQHAVDLAVQQNAKLAHGYTLTVSHVDESSDSVRQDIQKLAANSHTLAVVGPMGSEAAVAIIPIIEQNGLTTISPTAMLPGLTQQDQAAAEGLTFSKLHPQGKPVAFFRIPATDSVAGKLAADTAVATAQAHGLAARSVFIVDDGTPSGKALASSFSQELKAKHGTIAGQQSLAQGQQNTTRAAVTAIIRANPDLVFFAGGIAGGAQLRRMLTLSGAPGLTILTAGAAAGDPGWSAAVGVVPAAANTVALLPASDLSTLSNAKNFVSAYQSAYSGEAASPAIALAYDAAMDEIAAIKAMAASGKAPTRAGVLSAVASTKYSGVSGTFSFNAQGDNTTPPDFSLYTCDIKGAWTYETSLHS
jgi:branched-chain amino acid transport system substrate-binding protein